MFLRTIFRMLSPLIRKLLVEYRSELAARFGPERVRKVCLFGSWARGEATDASDVDIAAIVSGLTTKEWKEAVSIAADVEASVGHPFSPFVVSLERFEALKRGGGIGQDIEREGISS